MNMPALATTWSSSSSVPIKAPCLLVVDDDRAMRVMLKETLAQQGYEVLTAETGELGLAMMLKRNSHIDAVILDQGMPGISGLEVVTRMKKDPQLSDIPVIMLTGVDKKEKIQEGIDAGVYYYLVKPVEPSLLRSIASAALRERRQKQGLSAELNRHGAVLRALRHCSIQVHTLIEAEDTACFLASCFPNPERVVTGLMELLVNAVEHGNLGIAFEEKCKLLEENRWREEIDRRAALPENIAKKVEVTYQRKEGSCLIRITDSGPGFDWKRYWHINPARATASNGRGITRARLMAFDRMSYNEKGNSVTIMVSEVAKPSSDYAW